MHWIDELESLISQLIFNIEELIRIEDMKEYQNYQVILLFQLM